MVYQSWSVVFGEQPSAAKWNILGTNDSSFNDGTGIAAGAISAPEKLVSGAGTAWDWQSWTPTYANLTVGNGTSLSTYCQIGKVVFFKFSFVFGTTSAMGTGPTISLPVTADAGAYAPAGTSTRLGQGRILDAGTGTFHGSITYSSTTVMSLVVNNVSGTYESTSQITSTVPFTWTTSDAFAFTGFYEAA